MPLYDRSRARRSVFDTIAYRVASQLATAIAYVVLVRTMSKEDFGIFNLLYAFIPLVGTAASLGLEQTLRRYQPEYLRQNSVRAAAWLVERVARLRFATNLTVLSIVLLAWNLVAPRFDLAGNRPEFAMFCLLIMLHFQTQILQMTMAAHMLHRYSVGSIAILSYGKLIGYSFLAFAGILTLRTAIIADTISYAAIYVFLQIMYRRRCIADLPAGTYVPAREERRRLIRYGLFNNFNDAGTLFLDSRIDNFFIAAFMSSIAVGIYSFYMRLNDMLMNVLPGRLFDNIIQPMFFAVKPTEADARLPQYFTFLLNANLLLLWPLLTFTTAYHAEIVRVVFGGKYVDHSWLLPIILGFATANCFSTPVALVAQYEEKPHIQLLSKIFAIYNVAAMIVLIPRLGLYGAALAIGSSQIFKNVFVWWFVRRRAVWINARAAIGIGLALWGCALGACLAIKATIGAPRFVQLLLGVLVVGATALIHVRSAVLCASDRELLLRLFQGREMRWLRVLGLLDSPAGTQAAR
jgi:O-antigen/teichoic acid export membrane protein